MNDTDLRLYEDISQNVDLKRLLPFIGKAQQLDLRQFMGKAFYDDFIQNFSNDNGVSGDVLLTVKATTAANGSYLNQSVATTSGSGTGATFDISVYGGYVTSVKVNQPGSGYNIGDTLTFTAIPGAVLSVKELAPVVVIAGGISQAYRDLFDGKLYEDKQGHTIQYILINRPENKFVFKNLLNQHRFEDHLLKNKLDDVLISLKGIICFFKVFCVFRRIFKDNEQ
jgi:hypothetical protein